MCLSKPRLGQFGSISPPHAHEVGATLCWMADYFSLITYSHSFIGLSSEIFQLSFSMMCHQKCLIRGAVNNDTQAIIKVKERDLKKQKTDVGQAA